MENKNTEIAIRLAMEMLGHVAVEEPTDEQILEVNKLSKEILAADPESELGKKYAEEVAKGENSEYVDRYDYYGHYVITVSPAVADILTIFAKHAEELRPRYAAKDSKERAEISLKVKEIEEKVYLEIHEALNHRLVPVEYYSEVFNFLSSMVTRFNDKVKDTITVEKDMLLSIIVGAKHPEYGNYAVDFATEREINTASKALLAEKGIDRKEYFGE